MSTQPKELITRQRTPKTPSVRKVVFRIVSRVNPAEESVWDYENYPEIANEIVKFLKITLTFRKNRNGTETLINTHLDSEFEGVRMFLTEL